MEQRAQTDPCAESIRFLKGVGEKRAKLYEKLGILTLSDLLRHYPRYYMDWSDTVTIVAAPLDAPCCIKATALSAPSKSIIRKNMTLFQFRVSDGTSNMQITLFNNPYAAAKVEAGRELLLYGKVTRKLTGWEMVAPDIEPAETGERIRPIYRLTEGLSSRMVEANVTEALRRCIPSLEDPLPPDLRQPYKLCHLGYALQNIHAPASQEACTLAKRRLVFEELFFLQLGLLQMKAERQQGGARQIDKDYLGDFLTLLPFPLTSAQQRAIGEITSDMASGTPMNRLLQGDVGSGKTAVAAAACHAAVRNGWQAALMAPTEILAAQHYHSLQKLLGDSITLGLLTASTPSAEKKKIKAELQSGTMQFVVGTHALLQADVNFYNLGIVVTDEQHRFGVAQRARLAGKSENPHLLVMSATPIPRTLSLLIYGDLDISILDELPQGRKPIDTYRVDSKKHDRLYNYTKKFLEEGRQGYIICPLIEENESDVSAAQQLFQTLQNGHFKGYHLGLLHGKLPAKEKEQVMREFAENRLQLLVCTTVVEVGVDVPNAVIIIIENAERFGLSQLHQLRGRVGRGEHPSTCVLVSDAENDDTLKRLQMMCQSRDGFEIAEADLKLRGPGDFFGHRQHGLPQLKIADMFEDMATLREAQAAAKDLLKEDASLASPEHRGIHAEIKKLFSKVENSLN